MRNKCWDRSVVAVTVAVWIYTLAGFVGAMVKLLDDKIDILPYNSSFWDRDKQSDFTPLDTIDGLKLFCAIVTMVGYYLFYLSASRLADMQRNGRDGIAFQRIINSYVWLLIACVLNLICMGAPPLSRWYI